MHGAAPCARSSQRDLGCCKDEAVDLCSLVLDLEIRRGHRRQEHFPFDGAVLIQWDGFCHGMTVAIVAGMCAFLRFMTIAISVLVLVIVLTVCGEAVACGGCLHACCVKIDRSDRRQEGVVAKLLQACSTLLGGVRPTPTVAVAALPGWAPVQLTSPLLEAKVAQLRV